MNTSEVAVFFFAFVSLSSLATAQLNDPQILHADPGPQTGARFGYSVALHGNTAVVGAMREHTLTGTPDEGAVYVFNRTEPGEEWRFAQRLVYGATQSTNSQFGIGLSLREDRLAVGAYGYQDLRGAVFVYERDAATGLWGSEQLVQPGTQEIGSVFGQYVAFNKDATVLAVGSRFRNNGDGSVLLFSRSSGGWDQEPVEFEALGADKANASCGAVAIDDTASTLVLGCFGQEERRGVAYVFERSGASMSSWNPTELVNPVSVGVTGFGIRVSVSADGGLAAVAAWTESVRGDTNAGVVRLYAREQGWDEVFQLQSPEGQGSRYGVWVELQEDLLGVGCWYAPHDRAGAAFLYERNGNDYEWNLYREYRANVSGEEYGVDLAYDTGGTMIIGAWGSSALAGSAYFYWDFREPTVFDTAGDDDGGADGTEEPGFDGLIPILVAITTGVAVIGAVLMWRGKGEGGAVRVPAAREEDKKLTGRRDRAKKPQGGKRGLDVRQSAASSVMPRVQRDPATGRMLV